MAHVPWLARETDSFLELLLSIESEASGNITACSLPEGFASPPFFPSEEKATDD
jgi:hypothetical protein